MAPAVVLSSSGFGRGEAFAMSNIYEFEGGVNKFFTEFVKC